MQMDVAIKAMKKGDSGAGAAGKVPRELKRVAIVNKWGDFATVKVDEDAPKWSNKVIGKQFS